jgi:hypothetical protein
MEKEFEKLAIVIAATILVARKLATAPRNSPLTFRRSRMQSPMPDES